MSEPPGLSEEEARRLPPLVLAYVGDAVHELDARTRLVLSGATALKALHREAVRRVRAEGQRAALERLQGELTPDEANWVRRGRNVRMSSPAERHPRDVHASAGFETLLGYLHLTGQTSRLRALLDMAWTTLADSPENADEPRSR